MNVTCAIKDKANFEILSMGMFPAELVGLNLEMITETTCDFPKMFASSSSFIWVYSAIWEKTTSASA